MENILENNKIIAEFLEFKKVNFLNGCYTFIIPDYLSHGEYKNLTLEDNKEVVAWDVENLIFHNDWNWIMQVVEKIESLNFVVQIHLNSCFIKEFEHFINNKAIWRGKSHAENKIEAVYSACIEFIKWYNINK